MKYLTYEIRGQVMHGLLNGNEVTEIGQGDLMELLSQEVDIAALTPTNASRHQLSDVRVRAPIIRPGKIIGVAANYQAHIQEAGLPPIDKKSLTPRFFLMPSTAIADPCQVIRTGLVTSNLDWEAELVVVIGRRAYDVPVATALDCVAGYTIGNDLSARAMMYPDMPFRSTDGETNFFDWLAGKWADGFAPIGPYLVSSDEARHGHDLEIQLRVNGTLRQQGRTSEMIFTVAEQIAYASRIMTLEPGDLLFTGTPSGVGATTDDYLKTGDKIQVQINGLGTLTNEIVHGVST